jgi:hypothetical protein
MPGPGHESLITIESERYRHRDQDHRGDHQAVGVERIVRVRALELNLQHQQGEQGQHRDQRQAAQARADRRSAAPAGAGPAQRY